MDAIFQTTFSNEFSSLRVVPKDQINNIPAFGSANGLVPAIVWTNDDIVYWLIYASLGLKVFTTS